MATDTRYAYAVSRIRALEPSLVDRPLVDRLIGESPEGLLRWARESVYAPAFAEVDDVNGFPTGLRRHMVETFDLLDRIAPDPELMRVFRLRDDYHNLKILFKAQDLDRPVPAIDNDAGTIPFDRLVEIVREKDWVWLPTPMIETWRRAEQGALQHQSRRVVNAIFENGRYAHSLAIARKYRNEWLEQNLRQIITMHNIQTFLRVKDGAASREEFGALLIEDGILDEHFYRRHFDEPAQLFLDSLGRTDFARHVLTRGIEALPDTRAYWRLDIARDNYFLYFLRKTSADCFTIGPLVWYLHRKRAEVKMLRMLWLAAKAGWDRATVRERLRSIYV